MIIRKLHWKHWKLSIKQLKFFPSQYNRDLETQQDHKHGYGCKITVMEYFRYDHTTVVSYHQPLGLWAGVNSKNNTSYNLDTVNILLTVCRYCQKILLITEIFQSILHSQISNCIFLYELYFSKGLTLKKFPFPMNVLFSQVDHETKQPPICHLSWQWRYEGSHIFQACIIILIIIMISDNFFIAMSRDKGYKIKVYPCGRTNTVKNDNHS